MLKRGNSYKIVDACNAHMEVGNAVHGDNGGPATIKNTFIRLLEAGNFWRKHFMFVESKFFHRSFFAWAQTYLKTRSPTELGEG